MDVESEPWVQHGIDEIVRVRGEEAGCDLTIGGVRDWAGPNVGAVLCATFPLMLQLQLGTNLSGRYCAPISGRRSTIYIHGLLHW